MRKLGFLRRQLAEGAVGVCVVAMKSMVDGPPSWRTVLLVPME